MMHFYSRSMFEVIALQYYCFKHCVMTDQFRCKLPPQLHMSHYNPEMKSA